MSEAPLTRETDELSTKRLEHGRCLNRSTRNALIGLSPPRASSGTCNLKTQPSDRRSGDRGRGCVCEVRGQVGRACRLEPADLRLRLLVQRKLLHRWRSRDPAPLALTVSMSTNASGRRPDSNSARPSPTTRTRRSSCTTATRPSTQRSVGRSRPSVARPSAPHLTRLGNVPTSRHRLDPPRLSGPCHRLQ